MQRGPAALAPRRARASDLPALRAAGADHAFRPPAEIAIGLVPAIFAALDGDLRAFVESYQQQHGARDGHAEVID